MKISSCTDKIGTQISVYIPYSELNSDTHSNLMTNENKPIRITRTYKMRFSKIGNEIVQIVLKEIIDDYDSYFYLFKRIGFDHVYDEIKIKLRNLDSYEEDILKYAVELACSALFNQKNDKDVDTLRDKYGFSRDKDLLVSIVGTFGYGKTTLTKKVFGFDDTYSFLLVDNGRTTISNSIVRGMLVDNDGKIHIQNDENGESLLISEGEYHYKNCIYLANPAKVYSTVIVPHLNESFELYCSQYKDGVNKEICENDIIKKFITDTKCNLDGLLGSETNVSNSYYQIVIQRYKKIISDNQNDVEGMIYDFSSDELLKENFVRLCNNYIEEAICVINNNLKTNSMSVAVTRDTSDSYIEKIEFELLLNDIGNVSEECYKLFTSNSIKGGGLRILVSEIYTEVNFSPNFLKNSDLDYSSDNIVTPENLYDENNELRYNSIVFADTVGCSHVQNSSESFFAGFSQDIIGKSALLHESDLIILIDKANETMTDNIKGQLLTLENLGCKDKVILCYSYYNQFVKKEMDTDSDRVSILKGLLNGALMSLYPDNLEKAKRFYKLLSDDDKQIVYLKGLVKRQDIDNNKNSNGRRKSITTVGSVDENKIANRLNEKFQHSEMCISELIDKMILTVNNIREKENNRFSIINTSSNDSFSLKYSDDMYNAFKSAYLSYQNKIYNVVIPAWNTSKALCYNAKYGNAYFEGTSITLAPFNDALFYIADSLSKFLDKYPPIEIGTDEDGNSFDKALKLDFLIDKIKVIHHNKLKEYYEDILVIGKRSKWGYLESLVGSGVKKIRSYGIYEIIKDTFEISSVKPQSLEFLRQSINEVIDQYGMNS